MAVLQMQSRWLIHRYRGQAPSHIGPSVFAGLCKDIRPRSPAGRTLHFFTDDLHSFTAPRRR